MKVIKLSASIIMLMFVLAGCSSSSEKKITEDEYADLSSRFEEISSENIYNADKYLNAKYSKIELETEFSELSGNYEELSSNYEELIGKFESDAYKKEIESLKSELSDLKKDKKSVKQDVSDAKKELSALNGDIIKAKGNPISLPAGEFTVGTDFLEGRYRIYDGNSNFVSYRNGKLKINIILGNDASWGQVSEYIYEFNYGDTVTSGSPFKLQAIAE